jgi:hypothetical protein
MMPISMRRKACGMEKVENLYRTARVQNAMPPRPHHVGESGSTGRVKSARRSGDFRDACDGDCDDTNRQPDRAAWSP